ncbi:MAG: PD-(D/E)XK nuclease family protein, partial [Methanoregula sp.]|nr:PD-(D/E)XK nuclease family protein [Methanoregula sp.]
RPGPIMIGDNPLLVGVKVPNPADNYEMTESAVMVMLRELQRQKERAERKRLLYVALTRARDHLFMSGSAPEDSLLSFDLGRSRIEWVLTALSVTGDAIAAGGLVLPSGLRLSIVSDPLAIPAETGRVHAREPGVSKYLPGFPGAVKGTIIHEVLRGRDASTVLKEYGEYSEEHVRQCEEIRSVFLSSDLMKRVKRSFCEVPFVVTFDGKPVTGKIDRLCELEDGSRVAIDYKSEVSSDFAAVAEEYFLSVSVYVAAAQQLIGGNTVQGLLYFTETGEFRKGTITLNWKNLL